MPANSPAIAVLNGLTDEVRCSIALYRDIISQPTIGIHSSLTMIVDHLDRVAAALKAEVHRLGGVPSDSDSAPEGSRSSAAYDPERIAEGHHPLLEQIERQERHLEARFEAALADTSLPPTAREVIDKACASIRSDCQLAHVLNRGDGFGVGIPGLV
jgi:hypothetical protein